MLNPLKFLKQCKSNFQNNYCFNKYYKINITVTWSISEMVSPFTCRKTHCPPKVKVQLALLFSSLVHNSSINELKIMKLSEHISYEMID